MRYSKKAVGLVLRGDDNVAEVFPDLDLECAPPFGLGRVTLEADLNRLTRLIDSSVTALSAQAEGAGPAFVVAKEAARAPTDNPPQMSETMEADPRSMMPRLCVQWTAELSTRIHPPPD
jgi:hypothetical protein